MEDRSCIIYECDCGFPVVRVGKPVCGKCVKSGCPRD